jgi:hypothetical protein
MAVSPPNSLVLISDPEVDAIPESFGRQLIVATASCIAVGCKSETDGQTELTLGPSANVDPGTDPAFIGMIETPTQRVAVQTVLLESRLMGAVSGHLTKVRVWVNDATEPDRIIIGVG